ncbi:B-cell antigen receptor complex-associated protein beta chain [Mastacembelus armatus]|uniref:CD79b molecule, immunoglobulin-associated beta n=1 Tax=Mastacembelus armatus TaxID=205130 RepID=A0A3Q3L1X9_9TELE|nr:B-cell antigen receptor complex-associated protein beta chain [Mastacembelus armatus]
MRWLLAGCCLLALTIPSETQNILQMPRFIGIVIKHRMIVQCMCGAKNCSASVRWYKAPKHDAVAEKREELMEHRGKEFLLISNVQLEDNGVYFCKAKDRWGPGTHVKVVRPNDLSQLQYRTKMKDGLMILQGLLLAVFIAALVIRRQRLLEKSDSIYEEPETDHLYEGLAIETCGGGLYEELTIYAQAEGAEAPWE